MAGTYAIYDIPGNEPEVTNIHEAAEQGDMEALESYLKVGGVNMEALDKYGRTALMWAADTSNLCAVRSLLSRGANVHTAEPNTGRAAIHWASRAGSEAVVELLVKHGADIHKPDTYGLTPLYLALQKGWVLSPETPRYLITQGAKYMDNPYVNPSRADGHTGLTPEQTYVVTGVKPILQAAAPCTSHRDTSDSLMTGEASMDSKDDDNMGGVEPATGNNSVFAVNISFQGEAVEEQGR